MLWIDAQRLTEKQQAYLETSIKVDRPNIHLRDLRKIPAYNEEPLYNQTETNPHWRSKDRKSLIWRQVDAAKVLVSLQGDFDQTFFADFDHAQLDLTGSEVQGIIKKHGLVVSGAGTPGGAWSVENILWGFSRNSRNFFEEYYATVLESAYRGDNGWRDMVNKVKDFAGRKKLTEQELLIVLGERYGPALQPGSPLYRGKGDKEDPLFVSADNLASVFKRVANGNNDKKISHAIVPKAAVFGTMKIGFSA